MLVITDESALICALDPKQILSWQDFEYVLCLVIENRLLKLYQAHLERQYHLKWKELDNIILEEEKSEKIVTKYEKKKLKRKKQKKRNKKD